MQKEKDFDRRLRLQHTETNPPKIVHLALSTDNHPFRRNAHISGL